MIKTSLSKLMKKGIIFPRTKLLHSVQEGYQLYYKGMPVTGLWINDDKYGESAVISCLNMSSIQGEEVLLTDTIEIDIFKRVTDV